MKSILALILAGSAMATPILQSSKWKRLDNVDFQLVNLARNLESLELNYWNQGLNNFTDADFAAAGYSGFRYFLSLFRDQEIAHFTILNNAAGGGFTNCTYKFPVTTPGELISVGQVITSVGEGAFIGALGNLTDGAAKQSAGAILGNEARQNSKLRDFYGLTYFNAINFDTPLTASQAYSLAAPFLQCPSSNPPIAFPLIPALKAAFANGAKGGVAGDTVNVTWNSAKVFLGTDVHIRFLNDLLAIDVPLTQTGAGAGTVKLPAGIHGTAFLVATNYAAGGPVPDGQNFAVGYLVAT